MQPFTFGVISDPTNTDLPTSRDQLDAILALLFNSVETATAESGYTHITVISGDLSHPASSLVYEAAEQKGWKWRVGKDWGQENSGFFEDCDLIMQLGDDQGEWCAQQEGLFRSAKPGHIFGICFL